ncbi:MAG: metallophosphoesterase family protein [Spirochaetota bacterium]
MRVLLVSDIHGNEAALGRCADEAAGADLLICAGDLTHFGGVPEARSVLRALRDLHPNVKAVAGNCDNREIESYLQGEGVLLGTAVENFHGLRLAGMSGALPGPVPTPYEVSDQDIGNSLAQLAEDADQPLILVSHQPPHGSVADRAMKIKHVGSRSLAAWISEHQPLIVISGHIHESFGHKLSGATHVINPGAFKEGRYAVIDIDPVRREVSAELKS